MAAILKKLLPPRSLWPGIISAILWAAVGVVLWHGNWLNLARLLWVDQLFATRQALKASPKPHDDLLIIGIDEETRAWARSKLGANAEDRYVLRHLLARLLTLLSQAGAKTAAVDYMLDVPVRDDVDDALASAISGQPSSPASRGASSSPAAAPSAHGSRGIDTVLGCLVTVRERKRPIEKFRKWTAEGNLIILSDVDGKFRRALPGYLLEDASLPIFAVQACRVFVGRSDEAGSSLQTPWVRHRDGSVEVPGRFRVPADMMIDFVGPAQTFEVLGRQFSAMEVLEGRVDPARFAGKLVLIGPALRHDDRFTVSVNPSGDDEDYRQFIRQRYASNRLAPFGREVQMQRSGSMSGIEIHANIASQILQNRYLCEAAKDHPLLSQTGTVAPVLLLGWIFWRLPGSGRHRLLLGLGTQVALFIVMAGGILAYSLAQFLYLRWVTVPLELLIAWTGQAACGTVYTILTLHRRNARIEGMFGSAVGQELLEYIKANPQVLTHHERHVATVLFADIRGFTPMTESLGPDQVIELLREHFECMWQPLSSQGAWVDKYVGDLIMAAWNVLQPMGDHALRGVRAAVGMKVALAELNRRRAARSQMPIEIGIGLHTGDLVSGNVGSRKRSNYTLIGDTVNLASRIEHEARNGELLISEQSYLLVKDQVIARAWGTVSIRGKTGLHTLYEVLGLAGGPMIPGKETLPAGPQGAEPKART